MTVQDARYLVLDSDGRRVGRIRRVGGAWHAWRRIGLGRERARFRTPSQAVRWAAEAARSPYALPSSLSALPHTAWILSPIVVLDGVSLHHVVLTPTLRRATTLRVGRNVCDNTFRGHRGGVALRGRTLLFRWRDDPNGDDAQDLLLGPQARDATFRPDEALLGPRHRLPAAAVARALLGIPPWEPAWPATRHLRLRFGVLARAALDALEATPRPPALRIARPRAAS